SPSGFPSAPRWSTFRPTRRRRPPMWILSLLFACEPESEHTPLECDTGPVVAEQPDEDFLAEFRPAVVRTWPQNGDQAVDPGLTHIEIVFSKDMQQDYVWVQTRPETYPTVISNEWDGPRMHVAEVELEPGTVYDFLLN